MGLFGAAFALFLRLFDWRNCAVTRSTPDLAQFFVPPDAWARLYGAEQLQALFAPIAQSGRSLYAITQISIDVAFPALYVLALVLALRWVFPAGHRWRMFAHVLPIGAGVADLLENIITAWVAWQGDFGAGLGAAAGTFTVAKWLLLAGSVFLLVLGYLIVHTSRARRLLQHLFFIRIPLLLGLLVFALSVLGQSQQCVAPSAKPTGLATVQNLLSVDNAIQFGFAVYCAFIACAVIIFAGTHLWRLAQKRIGIEPMGLDPQAPDTLETRLLFGLSAFVLALPVLLQLGIDGEGSVLLGATSGIAAAIATLLLVYVLRNVLLGRFASRYTDSAFKKLRESAASQLEAPVSRTLHRIVGPGFDICDENGQPTGRLFRGHALAAAVALALAVGYAIGGNVLNPIRALPTLLDVPPIAYVMLLIAFICMLFANLTFLLDRIRVPVVLAFAVWLVFWGNLPGAWYDTQHYFDVTFVPEGSDAPPSIARAFDKRTERAGNGPIIVVAAAGGGIQAAGWSAVVLEGLHKELTRSFTDSIYLVSATSGGSVGAYFFIEALRADALAREDTDLAAPISTQRDKYVGFSIEESELTRARTEGGLQYLDQVPKAAMASSLEATAWGLVFPDLRRLATPFLASDNPRLTALDRAWAIEQAWHRWRSCMVTDTTVYFDDMEKNPDCRRALSESPPPARLSDWWQLAAEGVLPGVILNGTVIENGEQFLASSLDLRALDLSRENRASFAAPERWTLGEFDPALCEHYPPPVDAARLAARTTNRRAKAGTDMSAPDPCASPMRFVDMRAVTAARLSATFPYVTPVARARVRRDDSDYEGGTAESDTDNGPRVDTPPWHVGDGGYFDNPGSVAVFRWIEAVRDIESRRGGNAQRPILFIQINPFPARPARSVPVEGQGWQAALLGPLQGMLSVRTSSQLARSDLELSMLEAIRGPCFEAVEFRPPYEANRADPPLSWELSRADRARLVEDWRDARNQATVAYLKRTYFGNRPPRCGP
ncbi:MAG: hypothetical protein AAFS02_12335 [Pseudomonadota bacterium]